MSDIEDDLRRLDENYMDLGVNLDLEALKRMMAEEYTLISNHGTIYTKESYLEALDGKTIEYGKIKYIGNPAVELCGDTAIVTSRLQIEGFMNKLPYEGTFFATRIYVKKAGEWKITMVQGTRLNEKNL